jgi:uncharacterized protein YbjT (DUF2867 family)
MNNKILVLGASGNIGSFLTQYLVQRNADIIAGVPAVELPKIQKRELPGVALDFNDPASLDKAMQGINSLFLLLPMVPSMLNGGRNIIEAAQRNNIQFILRSSLIDAFPGSPYFLYNVHGRIDQLLRESDIPYAIVHPNSFMQNFVVYHANAINSNNSFSFTGEGSTKVSYIDVRDIATVDAEILVRPEPHRNKEYTVTGPSALSYDEVAGILSAAAGRTIRYVRLSEDQFREGLRKMGAPDWMIKAYMSFEYHINDGDQMIVTNDVCAVSGKTPNTFAQFARDYAQTWQKVPVHA